MVLFDGIRREEVEKLDWSEVNFKTGYIESKRHAKPPVFYS